MFKKYQYGEVYFKRTQPKKTVFTVSASTIIILFGKFGLLLTTAHTLFFFLLICSFRWEERTCSAKYSIVSSRLKHAKGGRRKTRYHGANDLAGLSFGFP